MDSRDGMEKIFGSTLEEVRNSLVRLPSNFESEFFKKRLSDMVGILHKNNIHENVVVVPKISYEEQKKAYGSKPLFLLKLF